MEEAAKAKIPFYVLDRPNPLTGIHVEGPMLDADKLSFVGAFPLPLRHGMTIGELARLENGERHLNADLHVIEMTGWNRADWFDATGLPWVNPSPNIRNLNEALLYPGLGDAGILDELFGGTGNRFARSSRSARTGFKAANWPII